MDIPLRSIGIPRDGPGLLQQKNNIQFIGLKMEMSIN